MWSWGRLSRIPSSAVGKHQSVGNRKDKPEHFVTLWFEYQTENKPRGSAICLDMRM